MKKSVAGNISDQELLDHYYADNNNEWLGILLQRYTLLLFGVCMKYLKQEEEARDAVQQVFEKVLLELPRYKVTYFKSWVYMIARNHCLMKLRDKTGRNTREITDNIPLADTVIPAEDHQKKEKVLTYLESSLEELGDEQKTCVTLFYLDKLSYNDIAERTGFSLLQVKSYIQNGKRNLKMLVEKKMKQ